MIDIIPKLEERGPAWHDAAFFLSLGILFISLVAFFIIQQVQAKTASLAQAVQYELAQTKTPETLALEKELKTLKPKIETFSQLLRDRRDASALLTFLEANTHPKTFFKTFSADLKTGEMRLEGIADSFATVEEQLTIFRRQASVTKVDLTGLELSGKNVAYGLTLSFSSDIFLPPQ